MNNEEETALSKSENASSKSLILLVTRPVRVLQRQPAMATWAEIVETLAGHRVLRRDPRNLVVAPLPRRVVAVRLIEAFGVEWIALSAPIGSANHFRIETALRQAESTIGALVIEGDRCVLRQTVCLAHIDATAVQMLVEVVAFQAAELRARLTAPGQSHPYADLFAG